ncbi:MULTISPECIES: hypothetical protein [Candidatus Ichthyocystis]|uniref:Uncharacterized protein n=1 Tax=Candidatus Ichthyocystis hellenicum TaxID=1561003 RepID=A0A0S4M6A7_9BURK|nr:MULTISPECIES: hypothetical protein [Ichthyocystis]CUT17672.1 hypothetical protein Ark11_0849 [Candidatus Ichthyocystis hellenicum]
MDTIFVCGNQYCFDQGACNSHSDKDDEDKRCCDDKYKVDTDYSERNSLLCSSSDVSVKISHYLPKFEPNKSIMDIWGVNLHPDDNKAILFIRRKFSIEIRDYLRKLFWDMLNDNTVLSSGKMLRKYSWSLVSSELFPIAMGSIKLILDEQYKKLDLILSNASILDFDGNNDSSFITRKIKDDEKNILMVRAKSFISRRLISIVRLSWLDVAKTSIGYDCGATSKAEKVDLCINLGVNVRCSDVVDILNVSNKFSCNIKSKIHDKFSDIIRNKNKFDDGTAIGKFNWFRVYRKLFPIAQEEVRCILEDENKELEKTISRARVVVNSTVDREITGEEKSIIVINIMRFVHSTLKRLCKIVWDDIINSLKCDSNCSECNVKSSDYKENSIVDVFSSAAEVEDLSKVKVCDNSDNLKVNICYDDDLAIYRVRKDISFEINRCICNKFINFIKNNNKSSDNIIFSSCSWKDVSKSMLPIARKEINCVIEKESVKINEILLKSRVDICPYDISIATKMTREITLAEISTVMKSIINSISKQVLHNLGRVWNRVVKSLGDGCYVSSNVNTTSEEFKSEEGCVQSFGLLDLKESHKEALDNIRIEFIGNIDEIIEKVVCSLSLKIYTPSDIDSIILDVSKLSDNLFKEEGFFSRVESLLVNAEIFESPGKYRSVTDKERHDIFKSFMDNINSDIDYLVRKRTGCVDLVVRREIFNSATVVRDRGSYIIDMWGLNIHPNDNKLILATRKKFSIKIRDNIHRLFYGMLNDKFVLPNGKVISKCPWSLVANELFPIAMESVRMIMEEQYKELDKILSKVRIVDNSGNNFSNYDARDVTSYEKDNLMARAKSFIHRRLVNSIRLSWIDVSKTHKPYYHKEMSECIYKGEDKDGSFVFKLRCDDALNIMYLRRKFSSKIRSAIYEKFTEIINHKRDFINGSDIGRFDWHVVSKELFPIAKEEIKYIFEDEVIALKEIISESRVLVDSGVDRELTSYEKSIVLKNIIKLVNAALKNLCRGVWEDVTSSSRGDSIDIKKREVTATRNNHCFGEVSSPSASVSRGMEIDDEDDISKLVIYHEDDRALYKAKKSISFEINRCVCVKFSNMLRGNYRFEDGTTISNLFSWKDISKKMMPFAKEEINIVLEKKRIKINDLLLRSRVDVSPPNSSITTRITREITSNERSSVVKNIMKSVFKQVVHNLGRVWSRVINSLDDKFLDLSDGGSLNSPTVSKKGNSRKSSALPVRLPDLGEADKAELDNIRLEFIGNLDSIICEVIRSMSLNFDSSFNINNVISAVSYRSDSLFKEEGFFSRLKLLLENAKIIELSGNDRFITDDESNNIFQKFMDNIYSDRDYLVKKRVGKFRSLVMSSVRKTSTAVNSCKGL